MNTKSYTLIKKILEKLSESKKVFILLGIIILAGIFLRTYDFHDLLRFGKDQARDASIIRNIIEKNEPLPLLGPKAGGTTYKMGPIFYYFQYLSASIFGASPEKLAYPDLLLSILTLPMIFLFLRKLFDYKISLMLTALYAVSFFAVQNGRFAWNPNSLPFFTMLFLYGLLELTNHDQKRKLLWASITGIALGIGVQLHTLFILTMIPILIAFSVYALVKKIPLVKSIVLMLLFAVILNIPQIIHEYQTGFGNTKSFFAGIDEKSEEGGGKKQFPNNILVATYWQIQANYMFLSSIGDDTQSHFDKLIDDIKDNTKEFFGLANIGRDLTMITFGTIFSILGYILIFYYIRRESDEQKKVFLKMIAAYCSISFLFLVQISHVLILRYFLFLQFIPFILLGLLMRFTIEKLGKRAYYGAFIAVFFLIFINLQKIYTEYDSYISGKGDMGIAIWNEEKFAGEFILKHSGYEQPILMIFEPTYAHKFIRSLDYFAPGISFSEKSSDGETPRKENAALFSLVLNTDKEKAKLIRNLEKSGLYSIVDHAEMGRIAIFKLNPL